MCTCVILHIYLQNKNRLLFVSQKKNKTILSNFFFTSLICTTYLAQGRELRPSDLTHTHYSIVYTHTHLVLGGLAVGPCRKLSSTTANQQPLCCGYRSRKRAQRRNKSRHVTLFSPQTTNAFPHGFHRTCTHRNNVPSGGESEQ